ARFFYNFTMPPPPEQFREITPPSGGIATDFKTVLLTGARGFAGRHLAAVLFSAFPGARIVCTSSRSWEVDDRFDAPQALHEVMDLSDPESIDKVVKRYYPDAVMHLAGHSQVADSWKEMRD